MNRAVSFMDARVGILSGEEAEERLLAEFRLTSVYAAASDEEKEHLDRYLQDLRLDMSPGHAPGRERGPGARA